MQQVVRHAVAHTGDDDAADHWRNRAVVVDVVVNQGTGSRHERGAIAGIQRDAFRAAAGDFATAHLVPTPAVHANADRANRAHGAGAHADAGAAVDTDPVTQSAGHRQAVELQVTRSADGDHRCSDRIDAQRARDQW
jgi:hypothetical protein